MCDEEKFFVYCYYCGFVDTEENRKKLKIKEV